MASNPNTQRNILIAGTVAAAGAFAYLFKTKMDKHARESRIVQEPKLTPTDENPDTDAAVPSKMPAPEIALDDAPSPKSASEPKKEEPRSG